MIPDYSMGFYTQEEAYRFLKFHRAIAKIYNIRFNELYSSNIKWDEKILEMMTKQIKVEEDQTTIEESDILKAEAIGT